MKTLLTIGLIGGLLSTMLAQTEIPPPWSAIQLTGIEAKVLAVPPPRGGAPIWIPITGGVITGGGLYWLLREDDTRPEPIAIIRDDTTTVPCGTPGTVFDPLQNDTGAEAILSVASVSGATIEIRSDGTLLITADGSEESIETTLQIATETGRTEASRLAIQVTRPPLAAVDDTGQTTFETPWSGNVLANDTATEPILSAVTQPAGGTVTFTPQGTVTFTPAPGFSGLAEFTYTVTGKCAQTASATVRIEVAPDVAPCDLTAAIETSPAACGEPTGAAALFVSPEGEYRYVWPDGVTGSQRTDLAGGTYAVTVTREGDDNCTVVFEVVVPATETPQIGLESSAPPSAPSAADGRVTLVVATAGATPYSLLHNGEVIGNFTGEVVSIGELGWGDHTFHIRSVDGCLSNSVAVSFSQLTTGWTVGSQIASASAMPRPYPGSVEHPVAGTAPRSALLVPGIRLAYYGKSYRHTIDWWPAGGKEGLLAVGGQWRQPVGVGELLTGPGILLATPAFPGRRLTWRWTAAAEWCLSKSGNWWGGLEIAAGPSGWSTELGIHWRP